MRLEPPKSPVSPIMWFAVLGPPVAWAMEFWLGYWATQTDCGLPGKSWDVGLNWWGIGLMIASAAIAVTAGVIALAIFRGVEAENESPPPAGRVRFLAIVGMTMTVLFTFMIVMTGLGIVILPNCHQS